MFTNRQLVMISVLSILISGLLSGCGFEQKIENIQGPSTLSFKVESTFNGFRRGGLVHFPANFDPSKSYPLVVVLHGAFSTGAQMEKETGFSLLADRENFIVIYPEGIGVFGFIQHWNAGHCCGKAMKDNINDIAFIEECIRKIAAMVHIDKKRIYMTGFSNGAMMTYHYANHKGYSLAAIAALGGSIGGRSSADQPFILPKNGQKPLPVFIGHGMEDTHVPPQGGKSPKKGGTREYVSLEQGVAFWHESNNCNSQMNRELLFSDRVSHSWWENCGNGSEVHLYEISGWKHQWPSPYFTRNDTELRQFDISSIIWEFFKNHSLL